MKYFCDCKVGKGGKIVQGKEHETETHHDGTCKICGHYAYSKPESKKWEITDAQLSAHDIETSYGFYNSVFNYNEYKFFE